MKSWPLITGGLLLAVIIASTALGVAGQHSIVAASPAELTVTLVTDSDNYLKGDTIQVSGTVRDLGNVSVQSGTVTIQYLYGDWSRKSTVQIVNGSYGDSYYISYGNPHETWTITASATDSSGNTGTASKTTPVSAPENDVYTFMFTSPYSGINYLRGQTLTISVENAVVSADAVFANSPTGENIPLSEKGSGRYEGTYTIKFSDPAENWSMSVEVRKTADNTFRAGGAYLNIIVVPAPLTVNLQSPTENTIEVGKIVQIKAEVLYPYSGGTVENATVTVNDPVGGGLTLASQGSGVYSASYTPQSSTAWAMRVQVVDLYGNSGGENRVVFITTPPVPGLLERFWWAILAAVLAIAFVSVYSGRAKRLALKLEDVQREMKEIPRLKKEAAIKYFKDGAISRSAYDGLVKRYDARMDELKRQEATLKVKLKKRKG